MCVHVSMFHDNNAVYDFVSGIPFGPTRAQMCEMKVGKHIQHIHTHTHTHTHRETCTNAHTQTHPHTHAHTHRHTYTHMHTHTHTHTSSGCCLFVLSYSIYIISHTDNIYSTIVDNHSQ